MTRCGPPSSWSTYVVSTAPHVEVVPQAKWACAGTAQRTRNHLDLALRKLMLRHHHAWPRVHYRHGSSATAKAHFGKHNTDDVLPVEVGAKRCKVFTAGGTTFCQLKSGPSAAKCSLQGLFTRPDKADQVVLLFALYKTTFAECCLRERGLCWPEFSWLSSSLERGRASSLKY